MKSQLISAVHRSDRNRVLGLLCEISGMLRVGFTLSIVTTELSHESECFAWFWFGTVLVRRVRRWTKAVVVDDSSW